MRESSTLANGRLVVNVADALKQRITKGDLTDLYALFLSLTRPIARERANLVVPPVFKRRHRQNSKVVPFHRIWVHWCGFGKFLQKREKINASSASMKTLDYSLRIFRKRELFPIQPSDL